MATVRFETGPGEQAQVDFGQLRLWIAVAHLFVFTLGYPRRQWARAYPHERLDVVLDGHELNRLLAAGADPNAVGGSDATPPLHWACWRGQAQAARALLDGGADLHALNRYGGDALDTTIHGSVNCHDGFGGIAMKLPEEIVHGDYPAIVEMLAAAGATLPRRVGGSEPVQEVLRRPGIRRVSKMRGRARAVCCPAQSRRS